MSNTALKEGLAAYRAKVEAGEIEAPTETSTPWTRFETQDTRKTAIDAMCVRCMSWDRDGERPAGVIETVRGCTDTRCPLHAWRPYR